jgi:hypothetical protein
VDGLHDEALGYAFLGVFLLDPATQDRVLGVGRLGRHPPDMRVRRLERATHRGPQAALHARDRGPRTSGRAVAPVDIPILADDAVGVIVVEP